MARPKRYYITSGTSANDNRFDPKSFCDVTKREYEKLIEVAQKVNQGLDLAEKEGLKMNNAESERLYQQAVELAKVHKRPVEDVLPFLLTEDGRGTTLDKFLDKHSGAAEKAGKPMRIADMSADAVIAYSKAAMASADKTLADYEAKYGTKKVEPKKDVDVDDEDGPDPDRSEFHQRCLSYSEKNGVSYKEAVFALSPSNDVEGEDPVSPDEHLEVTDEERQAIGQRAANLAQEQGIPMVEALIKSWPADKTMGRAGGNRRQAIYIIAERISKEKGVSVRDALIKAEEELRAEEAKEAAQKYK